MTKNCLNIVCDSRNKSWLLYILNEFVRIQDGLFDVVLNAEDQSLPTLHYGAVENCDIPDFSSTNISDFIPYNGGYVMSKTLVSNRDGEIEFDLFWNSFVVLSRLEEWEEEKAGKNIQSNSFNHPRSQKETFSVPIVNQHFKLLESFIEKKYPQLKFGQGNKPNIELSHDLDYINKTLQLRLKQTGFNAFNAMRAIGSSNFGQKASRTISFLLSTPSYWCFDYWRQLELDVQRPSTFYVYAKTKRSNPKRWLLDPSYNVSNNTALQVELKRLVDKGFEVGLHGSFDSAENLDLLSEEKQILQDAIGIPIIKTRQHWLRYTEAKTASFHSELFKYDSTIGWNDMMGYRAGCASMYRPYNHEKQTPHSHFEIPLVVMDSNIFDYGAQHEAELVERGASMLRSALRFKNMHLAISWHPRTCSSDYNWQGVYESYLRIQ